MRRFWLVLGLVISGLAVPTNQAAVFDGLPWSTHWEVAALLIFLVVVILNESRMVLLAWLSQLQGRKFRLLIGVFLALLPLKLAVYAAAPTDGQFEVCYRLFDDTNEVPCSSTFESSPWLSARSEHFSERSTSFRTLNFQSKNINGRESFSSSNWRNPTINSFAFDTGWRPWNGGDNNIEVFPFRAEFAADLEPKPEESLSIQYVGEGTLLVGQQTFELPASYFNSTKILIPLTESSTDFRIDFRFLRIQSNESDKNLPYAQLIVERIGKTKTVLVEEAARWVVIANTITDVLAILSVIGTLLIVRRAVNKVIFGAFIAVLLRVSALVFGELLPTDLIPIELQIFVTLAATTWFVLRRYSMVYLIPTYCLNAWFLVSEEIQAAIGVKPDFEQVIPRLRGNDHLYHYVLSRLMLDDGWLRGAEKIFYFQPGIRYYFFWLGLLFGDSAFLTGFVSTVLFSGAVLYFLRVLQLQKSRQIRSVQLAGVGALVIWLTSSHTLQSTIFGLSEFATWPLILVMVGIVMRPMRAYHFPLLGLMAGAITWIRPNQGLAVIGVLALAVYCDSSRCREWWRHTIVIFGSWFGILILIPIHNVAFGSSLVFQPIGARVAEQRPWLTFIKAIGDPNARDFISVQLKALFYLPSVRPEIRSPALSLAFPVFAAVFMAGVAKVGIRSKLLSVPLLLISTMAVVGQVVPYLKYAILRYYPIMLDSVYILMFAIGMLLLQFSIKSKDELLGGPSKKIG